MAVHMNALSSECMLNELLHGDRPVRARCVVPHTFDRDILRAELPPLLTSRRVAQQTPILQPICLLQPSCARADNTDARGLPSRRDEAIALLKRTGLHCVQVHLFDDQDRQRVDGRIHTGVELFRIHAGFERSPA